MNILMWLWNGVRYVVGLILPVFARAGDFRGMGPQLRWAIHVILLSVILVFLWAINVHFGLAGLLEAPIVFGVHLREFWLPILFLLVYVLSWLGWWLWKLLGPEEEVSIPDIDEAWEEAVRALHKAGIDLTEVPIFLVLGRPAAAEEYLFKGAQLDLLVKQAPARADAPLHVYGSREGVYISCAGASLTGQLAAWYAGEGGGAEGAAAAPAEFDPSKTASPAEFDPFKTLQPKGRLQDMQAVLRRAGEQGRDPQHLTEEEQAHIRTLLAEEDAEHTRKKHRGKPNLLKNTAEVERQVTRFKHLCRLIVRDRRPYCPLNGILVIIPLAGAETADDATETAGIVQRELSAARQVFQLHCPMLALICDFETAPGFQVFIERFPKDDLKRRVGFGFPLLPDLDPAKVPDKIESGADWMGQSLLPSWVYKLYRMESKGEDLNAAIKGNAELFSLMNYIRERRKRLGQVLSRGLLLEGGGPPLFGGCYLAGTGRDLLREQAFVPGVFRKVIGNQNFVSWTADGITEDAGYHRWTKLGYLGMGVLLIGLAALGVWRWIGS